MRRLFSLVNLFICFLGSAMDFSTPEQSLSARKYQAASNQFREGIAITETGSETGDYNEKAIFALKKLEVDKKLSVPLNDIAAKQLVANAISRKVVFLIVQKKNLTTASEWLHLQKAFTQDFESVAQN